MRAPSADGKTEAAHRIATSALERSRRIENPRCYLISRSCATSGTSRFERGTEHAFSVLVWIGVQSDCTDCRLGKAWQGLQLLQRRFGFGPVLRLNGAILRVAVCEVLQNIRPHRRIDVPEVVPLKAMHEPGIGYIGERVAPFTGELARIQIAVGKVQVSCIHLRHKSVILAKDIVHAAEVQVLGSGSRGSVPQHLGGTEWDQLQDETENGCKRTGAAIAVSKLPLVIGLRDIR